MDHFSKNAGIRFFLLACLVLYPCMGRAGNFECPKSVGYIQAASLASDILIQVRKTYQSLGCDTKFIAKPPKRLLKMFNDGALDGDLFRVELFEPSFVRDFVRSKQPVATAIQGLWRRPDQDGAVDWTRVGYIRGVLWQEKVIGKHPSRAFNSKDDMINAYNKGKIDLFLSAKSNVENLHSQRLLTHKPVMVGPPVGIRELYHYLDVKFSAFMKAFDASMHANKF